jgi:hypothetical protein
MKKQEREVRMAEAKRAERRSKKNLKKRAQHAPQVVVPSELVVEQEKREESKRRVRRKVYISL